jgi:hypothetical protein
MLTKNSDSVYNGRDSVWYTALYSHTFGSLMASHTFVQLNPSFWVASLSLLSRAIIYSFSSLVMNFAFDGQSAINKNEEAAMTTVKRPSMMKIPGISLVMDHQRTIHTAYISWNFR